MIFREYLSQFHDLPRIYTKKYIKNTENQFDHLFGICHDMDSEKFTIGDSHIGINQESANWL